MKFEVYKSFSIFPSQRYRWKLIGDNWEPVANSGEGFSTHAGAMKNAILTRDGLIDALPNHVLLS